MVSWGLLCTIPLSTHGAQAFDITCVQSMEEDNSAPSGLIICCMSFHPYVRIYTKSGVVSPTCYRAIARRVPRHVTISSLPFHNTHNQTSFLTSSHIQLIEHADSLSLKRNSRLSIP
jgi:hypothetical protein